MSRLITPSPRRFIPSLGIIRGALRDLEREAMPLLPSLSLALPAQGVVQSGAPFYPTTSLGASLLEGWDAENALSVPQSAGAVSPWTSLTTGSFALTQGTGSKRPIWGAASFGVRPGITFDGIDDCLGNSGSGVGALPTGANPGWVWSVASQDALVADALNRHTLSYGTTASSNSRRDARRLVSGTNLAGGVIGNGASGVARSGVGDYSGRHLTVVKASGTQVFVDFDSTLDVTGAAVVPSTGTGGTLIGSSTGLANFWNGVINSIWVTAPLGASDEANMRAFCLGRL